MITINLDDKNRPLYMRIYVYFKGEIEKGRLEAGSKLPSKRVLAMDLGVSVNTVDLAYGQLLSEGFISSIPKSGYYVCAIDELQKFGGGQGASPPPVSPAVGIDSPEHLDFSPAGFASDKFPSTVWSRLLKAVMEDKSMLKRPSPQGYYELRKAISDYLLGARGFLVEPESIVIGAGADNLLSMLSFIVDSPVTLAVENPVYNKAYRFFERMGHRVLPVDVDHDGIPIKPLEKLDNVVAYTTPSHQYPLGESMPIARRIKLLNWAAGGEFRYIIEDDYDSEFRYGTKPIPALRSIDKADRVVYLGTFSRSVAPALRIGYMVLPKRLLELYMDSYQNFSSPVSALDQAALARFMSEGYFEKHLNRMRLYYKNKRARLVEALSPLEGKIKIVGDNAGHHLTVKSLTGMSADEICRRALDEAVKVYPIEPYFIGKMDKKYEGKVLLGFGGLTDGEIDEGARRLTRAINN